LITFAAKFDGGAGRAGQKSGGGENDAFGGLVTHAAKSVFVFDHYADFQ
jgi:hypothetical protein